MMIRTLAALILLASPAAAEDGYPARLQPGDFVLKTHRWDADINRFAPADTAGRNACFEVTSRSDSEIEMILRKGPYHSWWKDEPAEIGFQGSWIGNDEYYLDANPDAPPFELTRRMFTTVPGCPTS